MRNTGGSLILTEKCDLKKKRGKKSRKFRYRLEYAGVVALGALSSLLGAAGRARVGRALGPLLINLLPGLKNTMRGNMRLAFPDWSGERIDALVRANAAHVGRVGLEFLAAGRMSGDAIRKIVRIDNEELLRGELAKGNGVIIFASHIGNWEYFANAFSASLDVPLSALGKRIHNPHIDRMVIATRERFGTKAVNNRQAARPVLKLLKRNECAGILNDQRPSRGEWVSSVFFGHTVATNPGLATLALRSGASVVYSTCLAEGNRYVLRFERVVEPPPDKGDREARIREFTLSLDRVLEESVRRTPEQWLWMHERWKLPKGFKPE